VRIAYIADIIGRPGRTMISQHLKGLRSEYGIDAVIANYENASHGFGLSPKNAKELLGMGIDVMTGGNHTWDKKEIIPLLESMPLLRPLNYPAQVAGRGVTVLDVAGEKLAVINAMGHFAMPYVDNVVRTTQEAVEALHAQGIRAIFIDMHAEATSEKRALFLHLKEKISALIGSHTHVGSDDLLIDGGAGYLTDVGLTGCRDNVIGMSANVPIERLMTGVSGRFEVPERCKKILQMVIIDIEEGRCTAMQKLKRFDDRPDIITHAWVE